MKAPRGLHITFDCVKGGRVFFDIRASRFYLFKTIMKIAGGIRPWPLPIVVVLYGFYYYLSTWRDRGPAL